MVVARVNLGHLVFSNDIPFRPVCFPLSARPGHSFLILGFLSGQKSFLDKEMRGFVFCSRTLLAIGSDIERSHRGTVDT